MKYLKIPNLPENAASVIVSECIGAKICKNLQKFADIIYAPNLPLDPGGISDHADCRIAHIGGNRFVVSPDVFDYYKNALKDADIICGASDINGNYPAVAAYNIAWVGNHILHNEKCTDSVLKEIIFSKLINVKQGYSKCSVCIVDENSIITEDPSITKAATYAGIDVLKISAGSVRLRGFDYGFFGGCSGKLAKNLLAVCGDIKTHKDCEKIIEFCKTKNVEIISLSNDVLTDFGSILPITEKE